MPDTTREAKVIPNSSEEPPFLGTWPRVYAAVLTYLAILLCLLYLATTAFHY